MSNKAPYTNGSSLHSSRSVSPEGEPVGELPTQPLPQMFQQPEERSPTPFPLPQQPIDQPLPELILRPSTSSGRPPLPTPQHSILLPISPSRPRLHQSVFPQLSNSGSSSSDMPPYPLTPTVHIIQYPRGSGLSGSSSQASFPAIDHLIRRLREDRRTNEESHRSIASGLYDFAYMMMPALPEFEEVVYDDLGQEQDLYRRRKREVRRCVIGWCVFGGVVGVIILGHQLATAWFIWRS